MEYAKKNRKKGLFSRKAQVEVITVMLILGITVAAVFIAYQFAAPQIERSKDISRIASMQKAFLEFDSKIREVRFEGEGAQRYIDINFDKGEIRVDQNDDTITFFMSAPGIESAPQENGMETYFSGRTINIRLQYGGEIEVFSKFTILNSGAHRIYIKNEGGNDVLLSLTPDIPITGETWTLQGYVYDNTEGADNDGTGDESQPSMDNAPQNGKILDATDDPPLANAEIIFFNQKLETVAIAKTNSQGRYAVKLPQSDGVSDLQLYMKVNLTSYVMKENDGASKVYSKTELYHKDFNRNLGTWHVNIPSGTNDFAAQYVDGFFNIPMYKLSKQDVFESVPIAVVMLDTPGVGLDVTQTDYDNLLFDVMDAFDSDAGSTYHCRYFVVYGGVNSPEGIGTGGGNWINYPDSVPAQNIEIYPIEWLLDPNAGKGPSDYGTYTMFNDIAAIDGNPDILNYKDFSLIVVATGATNDANLLPKLHTYKNDLSNFVSLGRLSFKGVDYSRGLVVFSQFSRVSNSDPDALTQFYPSGSSDIDAPDIYNVLIVPDGQEGYDTSLVGLHPPVYINSTRGGKMTFAANVRDSSEIIAVNAVVLNSTGATILGSTTLLDNGISPDRVAGDGTFSGEWNVPSTFSGTYRLKIEAIDEFGNLATKDQYLKPDNTYAYYQFLVTVDNTPPNPTAALSSSMGNLTTSYYTRLSSSIQDTYIDRITYETQRLYITGNNLPSEVNNYYSIVPLSEGIYNYSVITYDRADNYTLQSMIIDRDNTQPFINEYIPQGTTLDLQPWINVSYTDIQAGIAGAKLYYDGNPAPVATAPIDSLKVAYRPGVAQSNGTHSADVNISDKLGNVNWFSWQFNIGYEGPLISVTSPANPITFVNAANINVSGTSNATGGVYVNGNLAGGPPNFTWNLGLAPNSTNFVKIEADGAPVADPTNNSVVTRIVVEDSTLPSITAFNAATSSGVVKAGGRAYIDFNYNENYPAYYKITVTRGATILGETNTTINTQGNSFIKAGGAKRIVGPVDIYPTATNGLCDVTIEMIDLAGNRNSSTYNNALRIDIDGPVIQVNPPNNGSGFSTTAIQVSITDVNAGVFRDSLKMYILGESNSSGSSINLDVTKSVKLEKISDGYKMVYEPSWPFEDMTKVNITVEASDQAGNTQTSSTFYNIANNTLTIDNFKISSNRAAEGETVKVEFDVKQCVPNPPGTNNQYDAINEVTLTIGNLGKIVYVTDGVAGASRLVRSSTLSTLSGGPADVTVTYDGTSGGVCSGTVLYKYSFTGDKGITFTVPGYAGDLNNPIKVTAKNYLNIRKTYANDLYLITVKKRDTILDKTYGKYSWLPSLDGSDLSIGRVSEEPVGTRYQIYGEVHDVNRRIPVTFTVSGTSTVYNVSPVDSDKILWDRGYIVRNNAQKRFLLPTPANNFVDLVNYQNNIEKVSLENAINNVLPNEFALSVHGYFDTTNTIWTNSNFILKEKNFPKIYNSSGGRIISVPFTPGGPVLLIRDRRDTFNNLVSNVVVMTMDIDRYKNNRQAQGQNLHIGESYIDLARSLEENVIVWACGHELLIDS